MNAIAETDTYRAELDRAPGYGWMLTIVRKATGEGVSLFGRSIGASFRDAVAKYGAERAFAAHIRAAGDNWQQVYKRPQQNA